MDDFIEVTIDIPKKNETRGRKRGVQMPKWDVSKLSKNAHAIQQRALFASKSEFEKELSRRRTADRNAKSHVKKKLYAKNPSITELPPKEQAKLVAIAQELKMRERRNAGADGRLHRNLPFLACFYNLLQLRPTPGRWRRIWRSTKRQGN